ncbi:hypothetical protein MCAMS1_02469 [biofilm metagenome]
MKSVLFLISLLFYTVNNVNAGAVSNMEIEQIQKIQKEQPIENGSMSGEETILPANSHKINRQKFPRPKPPPGTENDPINIQDNDVNKDFIQQQ